MDALLQKILESLGYMPGKSTVTQFVTGQEDGFGFIGAPASEIRKAIGAAYGAGLVKVVGLDADGEEIWTLTTKEDRCKR